MEAGAGTRIAGKYLLHLYRCHPRSFGPGAHDRKFQTHRTDDESYGLHSLKIKKVNARRQSRNHDQGLVSVYATSPTGIAVEWYNGRTGRGHDAPFALGITVASLPADTVIPLLPLQHERAKVSRSKRKRSPRCGPLRPSE